MDKASRFTTSRLTPEQHRAQAEEIRKAAPELDWLAKEHERAASMIEHPGWRVRRQRIEDRDA
jgi:hypothetical protein